MPTPLLILAVTVNAVIGQLFLKKAVGAMGLAPFDNLPKFLLLAIQSPWVYLSIAIQGFGYVLWMLLVSRVKLGTASASVGAGFYVLMALCSWAIYGETLNIAQWLGIGLITLGVCCVGFATP